MRAIWILILLGLLPGFAAAGTATMAEQRALAAAESSLQLGFADRAEKQFAAFTNSFPKSEFRAQAVLRLAQARLKQGKAAAAIDLLSRTKDSGRLADEFQFWLGEAQFQNTNYAAAADAYSRVTKDFPGSPRAVESAYDEALARSRLGDWPSAASLLRSGDGAFQKAAAASPTNDFAVRGLLLLAESQLMQNDFRAAEETLRPLAARRLNPDSDWRRQFLLCRVQLADDRASDALAGATNLLALAASTGQHELVAEARLLQGGICERLKKTDDAIAAYEANLADDLPAERKRQALLKIVELQIAHNKTAAAALRLEKFLGQNSRDKAADTALLAAGELHLKQHLASGETNQIDLALTNAAPPSFTNDLQQAYAQFDWIKNNFPRSPVLGKALLNRAWCLWTAGQISESRAAFQFAAEHAAIAEDQAVARLKWADCQLRLGDAAGALTNYSFVTEKFSSWPAIRNSLFEPALYQTVRAALAKNDSAAATNALAKILAWYPESFLCESGLLLAGEKLSRTGDPAAARAIFAESLRRFPQAALAPEVGLAVARTYEQDADWPAAVAEYERWLTNYPGHAALPRAEFSRAWCVAQSGQTTNALPLFTNFVARFATNDLAPLAQNWIADFYLQGGDFNSAEANYQLLFQKWPASQITWQARLMAGRAASARQGYAEAVGYFTKLINDKDCPADLVAQAFFEYGDATARTESADTNKPLANFEEAVRIYAKIPQLYPTNDLAPLAWGRAGDCYLQLAGQDAKFYDAATNAYQKVLDTPQARVAARDKAESGIAAVLEKIAAQKTGAEQTPLLKAALDHHLNVALGTNLRDGETADAFWLKKSSLEAARLAESLGEWQQALNLYERLARLLPQLQDSLAKKTARAREHLDSVKK